MGVYLLQPVAWSTLTKVMRKAGLFDLAAEWMKK